jgi:hypothetical protein
MQIGESWFQISSYVTCHVITGSYLKTNRDWATECIASMKCGCMSPSLSVLRRRRRPTLPERPRHLLHAAGRQERTLMGAPRHRIGDGAVRGGEEQHVMAALKSTRSSAACCSSVRTRRSCHCHSRWKRFGLLPCWFWSHIDPWARKAWETKYEIYCVHCELTRKNNTRTQSILKSTDRQWKKYMCKLQ